MGQAIYEQVLLQDVAPKHLTAKSKYVILMYYLNIVVQDDSGPK